MTNNSEKYIDKEQNKRLDYLEKGFMTLSSSVNQNTGDICWIKDGIGKIDTKVDNIEKELLGRPSRFYFSLITSLASVSTGLAVYIITQLF